MLSPSHTGRRPFEQSKRDDNRGDQRAQDFGHRRALLSPLVVGGQAMTMPAVDRTEVRGSSSGAPASAMRSPGEAPDRREFCLLDEVS